MHFYVTLYLHCPYCFFFIDKVSTLSQMFRCVTIGVYPRFRSLSCINLRKCQSFRKKSLCSTLGAKENRAEQDRVQVRCRSLGIPNVNPDDDT